MANKDNREVLQSIRTLVSDDAPKGRILGDDDADEIAGMYSQGELNRLVANGVLAGDWESTKAGEKEIEDNQAGEMGLPEDFPNRRAFEKLGFNSVAAVQTKTREELIALDNIAERSADAALAYGK